MSSTFFSGEDFKTTDKDTSKLEKGRCNTNTIMKILFGFLIPYPYFNFRFLRVRLVFLANRGKLEQK